MVPSRVRHDWLPSISGQRLSPRSIIDILGVSLKVGRFASIKVALVEYCIRQQAGISRQLLKRQHKSSGILYMTECNTRSVSIDIQDQRQADVKAATSGSWLLKVPPPT